MPGTDQALTALYHVAHENNHNDHYDDFASVKARMQVTRHTQVALHGDIRIRFLLYNHYLLI